MPWLQALYVPLIAIGVGFHFGVTWVLFSRYIQKRDAAILWWLLGWILLTGHVLATLLLLVQGHPIILTVEHLTYVAAAYAFFSGQAAANGTGVANGTGAANGAAAAGGRLVRMVQGTTIAAAAAVVLAVWIWPGAGGATWAALAVSLATAWSFIAAARLAWPQGDGPRDLAGWLLLGGFAFGALHALDYSLFTAFAWKTLIEILENAAFSLVFAAAVTLRALAQAREVRTLHRVAVSLNRPLGGQETLEAALAVVLDSFRLTQGWAMVRREGRGGIAGSWMRVAAKGYPEWATKSLGQTEFPLKTCRCLHALDGGRLTQAVNVVGCPVTAHWTGNPQAGRHATIPLGSSGEVSGLMVLVLPDNRRFSPPETHLLTAIGEQVGMALDRARLYDEVREREAARGALVAKLLSAQEEERRRIARELHDEVGQTLTAIIVGLEMAARPSVTDVEVMRTRLHQLEGIAQSSLSEIRRVIHDLRPTVLDDLGLEEAFRWLVSQYLEPVGLQVDLKVSGLGRRLPEHLETAIFRLVQEAGTNIVKHAGARNVHIQVCRRGGTVTITVADDGHGLPPERTRSPWGGTGLSGMRERLSLVGGDLKVSSSPGRGTRLTAVIPLPGVEDTPEGTPEDTPEASVEGRKAWQYGS